jgi:hypothetical protein
VFRGVKYTLACLWRDNIESCHPCDGYLPFEWAEQNPPPIEVVEAVSFIFGGFFDLF